MGLDAGIANLVEGFFAAGEENEVRASLMGVEEKSREGRPRTRRAE